MSSERQLLDTKSPWWGEHVHRYNVVIPYLEASDTILDLACGTGFGSDILAQYVKGEVIGGDISKEAVELCALHFKRPNLKFEVLDGTKLSFEDGHFDKIISFETIEHTTRYREMLVEFCRVLKPGGLAFISTPNFPVNSPSGKVTNPYHTQEFTYVELEEVLKDVFSDVAISGQKYSRYDDRNTHPFGKVLEGFFNIKGLRKLPYGIKNRASEFFISKTFYPGPNEYILVTDKERTLKCKTFFCICRK